MSKNYIFLLLIGVIISPWPTVLGKRTEVLSTEYNYVVSWEVIGEGRNASVIFEVSAETTGYVGFGLSKTGSMEGADIVLGGVHSNGTSFLSDRHARVNNFPPVDVIQNWELLSASENATHTLLKFSRLLDTCDVEEDILIKQETLKFIWSVGWQDDFSYHKFRGAYAVDMLAAPYPEVDLSIFNTFDAIANVTMPAKNTTYWCTVHKAPVFNGKQHAVAFSPVLIGDLSKRHSHHTSLYYCEEPEGEDPQEFFDRYITQGGIDCLERKPGEISAYPYCTKLVYTWTIGGRIMHMPEGVGFPIGEREHMYYLMESHFDNPKADADISFESGVRIYYTDDLRPIEAGVMRIGQMYDYNFVIPPDSEDYVVVGHCSSNCTDQWVPTEGVDIFNVMLHSHAYGRKMKLRQFRDGSELPWVIYDENYDNKYQDNRNIPLRKFLPGDHMTIECEYDNSRLYPLGTVIGGFGTREEMCEVVYYYYPKMGLENCRSNIVKQSVLDFFGIESVQSTSDSSTNPMITAPEELAGMTYLEYLDSLDWTSENRTSLEELMRFSPHIEQCGGDGFQKVGKQEDVFYVTYPQVDQEYEPPPSECLA